MAKVHKHYRAIPKANRYHPAGRGGRHYIQSDLRLARIEEQDVCLAGGTKSRFPGASLPPEKRSHRFNLSSIPVLTDERICSVHVFEISFALEAFRTFAISGNVPSLGRRESRIGKILRIDVDKYF